jgi:hypothetical protein
LKQEKAIRERDRVLATLVEVRQEILAEASALSREERERVFLGTWSAMDLVAHLAGWDDTNISAAREVMAGQVPSFYASHDRDWQTYNAVLVSKYKRAAFDELMAVVRQSHSRLAEFAEGLPPESFNKDFGVRFHGYRVTIQRLLEAEAKDERVHLEQIRQFRRSLQEQS